jgi:hypothetical protein
LHAVTSSASLVAVLEMRTAPGRMYLLKCPM